MTRILELARLCRNLGTVVNSVPDGSLVIEYDSKFSLKEINSANTMSAAANTVVVSENGETSRGVLTDGVVNDAVEDEKDREVYSSEGDDMEGYESDTSSSTSSEDVMVEEYEDTDEEQLLDEEEDSVSANIQQLKVCLLQLSHTV